MARKSSSTTYKEYLSTFGAVSRHSIKHLYEYPVHRILEGTIEAVTPPADSPVQEQGELVRGNSSSQSLNSTITATEIPAQLLPINLNLENSNAKKTLGKRKKTSIQGISTSDSEDQE
ncbi:hypothetical protein LINPERPRIM_LOCUS4612 [Linum perenne]